MRTSWLTAAGFVLVLLGAVWAAQGVGWFKGSAMTGETFWAYAGFVTALVGAVLVGTGVRRGRRDRP
ncbi:MAG: hypothetical protein ACJ72E_07015 [Marmoricola sp.]